MPPSNRHQRRSAEKLDPLPPIPNYSGTAEACENCRFSVERKLDDKINHYRRTPKRAEDDVLCLRFPGGGVSMKSYGWCGYYEKREKAGKND